MKGVNVIGCAVAVMCMAVSLCYAAEDTAWFAGNNKSIGQGVQGFTSVQSAWDLAAGELDLKGNTFFKQLSAGEPSWSAIQKGWNLAGGEPSLAGLQSAWNAADTEPSAVAGNWGSGNLIMNVTDGLDEYAKLRLSNFIRPFIEKGLAAMTPQQDIHSFIADAKAGKVSMEQARAYVNQFQANQDAFQAASGAAFNEWLESFKDQYGNGAIGWF